MTERIAKFIASSGIASRRAAESLIEQGVVAVNGTVIDTPATMVDENDTVTVNGKDVVRPSETELYIFNKPMNTMTTRDDPQGRKTIYDCLPDEYKHLKYVGRLDYRTTGLLLMTNDGELARKLTLPDSKIPRVYVATVNGKDFSQLNRAREGMVIDGVKYQPFKIDILRDKNLRVEIMEGKKNEVRIVLRKCGLPVRRLHRISFGPIRLGKLSVGKIEKLDQKTIDAVLKSL
ncbi:MAG: pseudouridine synthase [Candidatus Enterousia sp.]